MKTAYTTIIFWIMFLAAAAGFSQPALADQGTALETLRKIPVQHGGRVKPFETFAREMLMHVTGRSRFAGTEPTELVWRWMSEPEKWYREPMIKVDYPSLHEEFSPMLIGKRISPEILLGHQPFLDSIRSIAAKRETKEELSKEEQKRMELYDKARTFQAIAEGASPGWLAHPEQTSAAWLSLKQMAGSEGATFLPQLFDAGDLVMTQSALRGLVEAVREDFYSAETAAQAADFAAGLGRLFDSRSILLNRRVLALEQRYNRVDAFSWAWKIYALAGLVLIALFWVSASGKPVKFLSGLGLVLFAAAFCLHTYGFYLRCVIAGRPPVSNMYESIVWVSWGISLFALALYAFYRSAAILFFAALGSTIALVTAQSFPAMWNPFVTPLVPVLRSNLWLTVHVLTITLSYAAFALAWALGHGVVGQYAWARPDNELQKRLTLFLYRAVQIGVVLLAAGTVLGGVWANYSWGRFWGWDPKETWALIALLCYVAVLHGRFAGWLGPFGFCVAVVACFLSVLTAWYGVNYVLAAGLHSYGFGGGGLPYVLGFVALDFVYLGVAARQYSRRQQLLETGSKTW